MASDFDSIVAEAQAMVQDGFGPEKVADWLKGRNLTVIEAIKVLRSCCRLSLGEAKSVVIGHPSWESEAEAGDALHDEIISTLERDKT